MRKEFIKGYIDLFRGKPEKEVFEKLGLADNISSAEKNIIYAYLFPKNLYDGELEGQIRAGRGDKVVGSMSPHPSDMPLLMNAYGTMQYKKYIRHLLHSFIECPDSAMYLPDTADTYKCGLCGKEIYGVQAMAGMSRDWAAYGSSETDIKLCPDCLVQLNFLNTLLIEIDGRDYLTWGTVIKRPGEG